MKPIRRDLLITGQSTQVSQTPQVDAEGQQVVQQFHTRANAGAGPNHANSNEFGTIPVTVEYASTAGEMANAARTACAGCVNWDLKSARNFFRNATGPSSTAEDRQTIATMRSRIMMAGYGYADDNDELDIDKTLFNHGICVPMNDWVYSQVKTDPNWYPVFTWREASCPSFIRAGQMKLDVVTAQSPYGFYKPKDLDQQKIGAQRYDAILQTVQGKR